MAIRMWRLGGRLPLVVDPVVTVVSWNLNVFTLGQRGHKAALLDLHDGGGGSRANGVAILARPTAELGDAKLIPVGHPQPDLPSSPERAMAVTVSIDLNEVQAVSWHAPFAGDGAKRKKKDVGTASVLD